MNVTIKASSLVPYIGQYIISEFYLLNKETNQYNRIIKARLQHDKIQIRTMYMAESSVMQNDIYYINAEYNQNDMLDILRVDADIYSIIHGQELR